jgi:hypothetical protein
MVLVVGLAGIHEVRGQGLGEARSVYVEASGGMAMYEGDLTSVNWSKRGWGYAATVANIGYSFTPSFSAAIGVRAGDYRHAGKPAFRYDENYWENGFLESRQAVHTTTWRYTASLMLEYNPQTQYRLSPYFRLGMHATQGGKINGWAGINQTAVGPSAGLGAIVRLSDRVGIVMGGNVSAAFPDRAIDGFTDATISDDRAFDLLGTAELGLRVRLNSSFRPVREVDIHGPSQLRRGEAGFFSAELSDRVSPPVTYEWEFGDGTRLSGRTASHTFTREDTFRVVLTVENQGSRKTASQELIVTRPLEDSVDVTSRSPATRTASSSESDTASTDISACREALSDAEEQYEQQQYSAARERLTPCLRPSLPAELRIDTFRLIALSYLGAEQFEEARNAVLRLLGVDPEYTPDRVYDPPRYTALVGVVRHQLGLAGSE